MKKEKIKQLSWIFIFTFTSFFSANQLSGQGVSISVGVGMPELMNLGVRLQGKQFQIGASVGTWPVKDESLLSISGDMFFHFGGLSELSERHPWYLRIGYDFMKDESETVYNDYYFLNLRIGRDFNLTENLGIEIDAGPAIILAHNHESKTQSSTWDIGPSTLIPSIGIVVFYRF